jgi:hypothetical protein
MKTVRLMGMKMLAVVLCVVLAAAGLTAVAQKSGSCKTIGHGTGYPIAIHVMLNGKPVAHAVTLAPGDYIVTATTKDASGMANVAVTATTPVAVTVTLSPMAK